MHRCLATVMMSPKAVQLQILVIGAYTGGRRGHDSVDNLACETSKTIIENIRHAKQAAEDKNRCFASSLIDSPQRQRALERISLVEEASGVKLYEDRSRGQLERIYLTPSSERLWHLENKIMLLSGKLWRQIGCRILGIKKLRLQIRD